jgi:hypothetical protein
MARLPAGMPMRKSKNVIEKKIFTNTEICCPLFHSMQNPMKMMRKSIKIL